MWLSFSFAKLPQTFHQPIDLWTIFNEQIYFQQTSNKPRTEKLFSGSADEPNYAKHKTINRQHKGWLICVRRVDTALYMFMAKCVTYVYVNRILWINKKFMWLKRLKWLNQSYQICTPRIHICYQNAKNEESYTYCYKPHNYMILGHLKPV